MQPSSHILTSIVKPSMVARDNNHYGIPDRQYVTNLPPRPARRGRVPVACG